jgi:hypothetical protein
LVLQCIILRGGVQIEENDVSVKDCLKIDKKVK